MNTTRGGRDHGRVDASHPLASLPSWDERRIAIERACRLRRDVHPGEIDDIDALAGICRRYANEVMS